MLILLQSNAAVNHTLKAKNNSSRVFLCNYTKSYIFAAV
jgi:hypothetical protein